MTEDIKPQEEDIEDIFGDEDETKKSNPTEGDDSEDALKLSNDALAEYNKRVGKSYKSWDDVAKREKEADTAFAKGEHKKVEPKKSSSINDEVVEELLLTKHPEAEHILDELKETAKTTGKSVLKLYRESKYFQGEAKAIDDAKKSEDEAKGKIKQPSNGTGSQKPNLSSIKEENIGDLTPEQRLEWLELQAEKERTAID